jgi:hypothetical protein
MREGQAVHGTDDFPTGRADKSGVSRTGVPRCRRGSSTSVREATPGGDSRRQLGGSPLDLVLPMALAATTMAIRS